MAQALRPLSTKALSAFRSAQGDIAREVVRRCLTRTEQVAHHGDDAQDLLTKGMDFVMRMLDSAMAVGEVALLEDELAWARQRLPHDGVSAEHVLTRFQILGQVVSEMLPDEAAAEVIPYLDWLVERQTAMLTSSQDHNAT